MKNATAANVGIAVGNDSTGKYQKYISLSAQYIPYDRLDEVLKFVKSMTEEC